MVILLFFYLPLHSYFKWRIPSTVFCSFFAETVAVMKHCWTALNLWALKMQVSQKDRLKPQDQGENDQWLYQRWRVGLSGFTGSAGDHGFSSEYEISYWALSIIFIVRSRYFSRICSNWNFFGVYWSNSGGLMKSLKTISLNTAGAVWPFEVRWQHYSALPGSKKS